VVHCCTATLQPPGVERCHARYITTLAPCGITTPDDHMFYVFGSQMVALFESHQYL